MSYLFCKRCTSLYYRNLIFNTTANRCFNIATPRYFIGGPACLRGQYRNLNTLNLPESVNLTYQKIESEPSDPFEDESQYPESFESLENIPLNKLISFRNTLNKVEESFGAEKEELANLTATKLNDGDLKVRNCQITQLLENILKHKVNKNCKVSLFGSAINGLWTDGSDLDVCIEIPNLNSRAGVIRNLKRISKVLGPLSPSRVFQDRFTAKIPILHWKRKCANERIELMDIFDSNNDLFELECHEIPSIDISVNNCLAVVNSNLIGSYVSLDPRVRELVLFLKIWAKNKEINNRSEGTLSSFSISLMLIHFLQNLKPPILPSLQDLAFSTNEEPNYISGVDCRFSTDLNKIKEELNYLTKGKKNETDNRTLLKNFFKYFGWFELHSKNKPITIRSVCLSELDSENLNPRRKNAKLEDRFLHVDNPFEVGLDVANIGAHQRTRITNEFRNAYRLLKCGNSLLSLLNS